MGRVERSKEREKNEVRRFSRQDWFWGNNANKGEYSSLRNAGEGRYARAGRSWPNTYTVGREFVVNDLDEEKRQRCGCCNEISDHICTGSAIV
ncbi:unnamed protein product [Dovyalis caffra]|uniref:Uncharacterized protein n=1 Tax=Dovyalis caffra TaxID=77055 RepID=A0AAV1RY65_9ROSI|nr:unnamed protein product [Dovyalis caffra]